MTYADGDKASKTINVDVPTTVPSDVTATVPKTLGLTLGAPATFGAFTPGVANTYTASTTANVISTMPDAALSVMDPSSVAPGFLVNTGTPLPQGMRARATNTANPNTAFANITGNPLTLLTYSGPISNDAVSIAVPAADRCERPAEGGPYSKTLTFTLSTTQP